MGRKRKAYMTFSWWAPTKNNRVRSHWSDQRNKPWLKCKRIAFMGPIFLQSSVGFFDFAKEMGRKFFMWKGRISIFPYSFTEKKQIFMGEGFSKTIRGQLDSYDVNSAKVMPFYRKETFAWKFRVKPAATQNSNGYRVLLRWAEEENWERALHSIIQIFRVRLFQV